MSLLFFPIIWSIVASGRAFTKWLRLPEDATRTERNLVSLALGLGVLAYAMMALGLLGLFYPAVGAGLVVVLALIGGREHGAMAREIWEYLTKCFHPSAKIWGLIVLFVAFGLVALVGVYTPPTVFVSGINHTEWDSLAYHLADPKLYLAAHRIYYLPWESHSNFAFTSEMWYTLGLMFGSVPLAKFFHLTCGIACAVTIYAFGARHLTPRAGALGALLFAATPLVFWEAGTAYVDLAPTFFAILTLLAVANGMATKNERWLIFGAILMGLTISCKALALTTLFLLAVGLLYWRLQVAKQPIQIVIAKMALWCVIALAVGSPWYIKSAVYTGNPVYPFAYNIFGGRYWTAEAASVYDGSNKAFGFGHKPIDLLVSPWNLTMYILPGHPPENYRFLDENTTSIQPFNNFQSVLGAFLPVLLGAMFFPVFGRNNRISGTVKALGLFALASYVFWLLTMQYARYLLPLLPVLCLLSAWVLDRSLAGGWIAGRALAVLTVCSVAFSLWTGVQVVQALGPVAFGQVPKDTFLLKTCQDSAAMQYINANTPKNAKIALYGDPFGFYCDRAYFWGESGHSAYIPYDQFHSPEELRAYFQKIGVTHILVNRSAFPMAASDGYPGWIYALTEGSQAPLFDEHGVGVWALPPARS